MARRAVRRARLDPRAMGRTPLPFIRRPQWTRRGKWRTGYVRVRPDPVQADLHGGLVTGDSGLDGGTNEVHQGKPRLPGLECGNREHVAGQQRGAYRSRSVGCLALLTPTETTFPESRRHKTMAIGRSSRPVVGIHCGCSSYAREQPLIRPRIAFGSARDRRSQRSRRP